MAKYLLQGSYTTEGIKGVIKEGASGRREAITTALKAVGGKLESMHYAFGGTDVFVIMDAPDNVTAASLAVSIAATGTISVKTTVLLTVEEMDHATKKAISYRGAGH